MIDAAPMQQNMQRELPDGWRWVRLSEVCFDVYRYPSFYGIQHLSSGVPVIRGEHINARGEISTNWNDYWFVSVDVSRQFPRTILKEGDLVFTVRGTIGKVGIVREFHDGAQISPNLIRISPNTRINSYYLWFYLQTIRDTDEAVEDNAVTVATVKASDLLTLLIPLPPLAEQQRIAAILIEQLSAVEQARVAAEAQLTAAKELPAAYLRAVFESDEARGWLKVNFIDIAEIVGGMQKTPDRKPTKFFKPYLTVRNVQRGYLDLTELDQFEVSPAELARLRLVPGDILIVEGNGSLGHIGRNALFDGEVEDCIHQNHIIRARPNREKLLPAFVSWFLSSAVGRTQLLEKARTTSGLYTLSVSKVASLEIPLPTLQGQQHIVAMLDEQMAAAEQARQALEDQLDTINQLPAALLRRAFSGNL